MSWARALVAGAVADVLKAAQSDTDTFSVFANPPETLNAPAIVVGRPTEVRYNIGAFGIDEATLPVVCVGPSGGDDVLDALITFVRTAIGADVTLGGVVPSCIVTAERNWRPTRIGGADLMAADVVLSVQT